MRALVGRVYQHTGNAKRPSDAKKLRRLARLYEKDLIREAGKAGAAYQFPSISVIPH
jgi:hypothetical protein